MATSYKTPGVYVEEISKLPPSVAQVETAIPAFIGYTALDSLNGISLVNKPTRIKALKEYEDIFGFPQSATLTITLRSDNSFSAFAVSPLQFRMYYALQVYFANGGGPCYIISVASYTNAKVAVADKYSQMTPLTAAGKEDEPTLLVFPDSPLLAEGILVTDDGAAMAPKTNSYYQLYSDALSQSATLMDRVAIIDVLQPQAVDGSGPLGISLGQQFDVFRTKIGNNFLNYGAAYYPWLRTTLVPYVNEEASTFLSITGGTGLPANPLLKKEADNGSLYHFSNKLYFDIKKELSKYSIILPPASAVAGVYGLVDSTRGVWKAPANVSLSLVEEPLYKLDDEDQQDMNVTSTGKSINAIRTFSGKGIMVWGARTLAGNDNEWRYISVRRFFNMVEESVKNACQPFVFEPNDANTWVKVEGMIENFLTIQWRSGALMGAKPDEAFFVHIGLGETMTALDVFEGRMIVEIGMAVVRPAEFIVLSFTHKMLQSS